jgi:hypothetical protein
MTQLMQANKQWATRPDEERFTSLHEMLAAAEARRAISRASVVSSRALRCATVDNGQGLAIVGPSGHEVAPTNWSFGQLATLAGAPAGYLRDLPAPLAADCVDFGLQTRPVEDVGILLTRAGDGVQLRAATGPRYGRIWDADVIRALVDRFGDGVSGDWRVPGSRGRRLETVTKANTTLYAGDRDMFVFLCDEDHRVEVPNRRDGEPGTLARGFFLSNSEVGGGTLRLKTFLFDFACDNRIVWGARELDEIVIRHTASAPDRFIDEISPALVAYSEAAESATLNVIQAAQAARLDKPAQWLANRFGPRVAKRVEHAHFLDEGRPIETIWDAVTGATAYARGIPHQSERVAFETEAGALLDLVEA